MKKILTLMSAVLLALAFTSCTKADLNNLEGDWVLTEKNETVERPNGSYEKSHDVYPLHEGEYEYIRFTGDTAFSIKEKKGVFLTEAIFNVAVADDILSFNGKNITIVKKTKKSLVLKYEKTEKDKTTVETYYFESIPSLNYEPQI